MMQVRLLSPLPMAETTKIEWTDATFNAWIGCTKVSSGCDNCYAESLAIRRRWHDWKPDSPRKTMSDQYWRQPLRWNERALETYGRPMRVFCSSLADVFDPQAPGDQRERLWELIRATPNLNWLLLTKRPRLAAAMLPDDFSSVRWPNVWVGMTAEDQPNYDLRWKHMLEFDAAVRFVSYEPMIGPLELTQTGDPPLPDWVIWGGESGRGARDCRPRWAREITAECIDLGIAVFGKQWGTYRSNPLVIEAGMSHREAGEVDPPSHGKGGALLDGRLLREFPARAEVIHSGQQVLL